MRNPGSGHLRPRRFLSTAPQCSRLSGPLPSAASIRAMRTRRCDVASRSSTPGRSRAIICTHQNRAFRKVIVLPQFASLRERKKQFVIHSGRDACKIRRRNARKNNRPAVNGNRPPDYGRIRSESFAPSGIRRNGDGRRSRAIVLWLNHAPGERSHPEGIEKIPGNESRPGIIALPAREYSHLIIRESNHVAEGRMLRRTVS